MLKKRISAYETNSAYENESKQSESRRSYSAAIFFKLLHGQTPTTVSVFKKRISAYETNSAYKTNSAYENE